MSTNPSTENVLRKLSYENVIKMFIITSITLVDVLHLKYELNFFVNE